MACLPASGGCERGRTDAFVNHLNAAEGSVYSHEKCLDVMYRDRAQPETLYRDARNGAELVIERKNVMWPLEYAQHHQADHVLFDLILDRLGKATRDGAYALALPTGISQNHETLKEFADHVAEKVLPRLSNLAPGQGLKSKVGQHGYTFWRQWDSDRDENAPQTGLMIELLPPPGPSLLDATQAPKDLCREIENQFHSCVRKFTEYSGAKRVLLMEPHGDLKYLGEWWWSNVLVQVPPPQAIDEIWLANHEYLTDSEDSWTFEKIYPLSNEG